MSPAPSPSSVITAGAAGAQRADEAKSDMIKEPKCGQRMNQLAFAKNLDSIESERLHIDAATRSEYTRIHSPPTHTHTHSYVSQCEGEGTFIFLSLAGLCATGAKAKGEERTQEGTHSSSLRSGLFQKGNGPPVLPRIIQHRRVSATNMANRIIRR